MVQGHRFLFDPSKRITLSRASAGIFLVLKQISEKTEKSSVLVPANICYAAVYPILYAGLKPIFCDVDRLSGNVTQSLFEATINSDVAAAIVPHMYGEPVVGMDGIAEICKKHGIILIEDCASAMGALSESYAVGEQGAYTIYSTGYSKTVDLGVGGLLTGPDIDWHSLNTEEKRLPVASIKNAENEAFFSKLYRFLRNQASEAPLAECTYKMMMDCSRDLFIHRADRNTAELIESGIGRLDTIISERRYKQKLYEEQLSAYAEFVYHYSDGAVPWRFNMLVPEEQRVEIIDACLKRGLPVSDWYPRVTPMFAVRSKFYGAEWHEKRIINFPLLIDDNEIGIICDTITWCLNNNKRGV